MKNRVCSCQLTQSKDGRTASIFFIPPAIAEGGTIHEKTQIALNGVAAGLYAAITILTASFAYGNIQFRIADALCVLVVLEPSLTVGLTLGCLISNIFSTVSALDIVIGTAGTLLGCLLAARVKKDWLVPVPIMLANAVLVGAMLAYVLTPTALVQGFFINGGEVLLGEAVVLYLLGVPLLVFFRKNGVMEKLMKEKR